MVGIGLREVLLLPAESNMLVSSCLVDVLDCSLAFHPKICRLSSVEVWEGNRGQPLEFCLSDFFHIPQHGRSHGKEFTK